MCKKKYLLTGVCFSVALGAVNVSAAERPWQEFSNAFAAAFDRGDVAELERLKRSGQAGFGNLDDLGSKFRKYGTSLSEWDQMIADARQNAAPQRRLSRSNSIAPNVDSQEASAEVLQIHRALWSHSNKLAELAAKFPARSRQHRVLIDLANDTLKLAVDSEPVVGFFRDEAFANQYMPPELRGSEGYAKQIERDTAENSLRERADRTRGNS
jgi:hypothetical protein